MPSDVIAIAVSTGIGVSVFAGVLSGVCYILAHGFTRKRTRKSTLQWYCIVCGKYLRSSDKEKIKVVICVECEERACKHQCSKRDYNKKQWICYNCLKRPSWLQNVVESIWLSYKKFKRSDNSEKSEQMGKKLPDTALKSEEEKEYVRDFMEKLVFTIVGGSVDDASIFRLYKDNHYQAFFDKYHQELSDSITALSSALQLSIKDSSCTEQNPSEAHTTLKSLIESIIQEARHLPKFQSLIKNPTTTSDRNERTYEELLATAILNKIAKQENSRLRSSADDISDYKYKKPHSKNETEWKNLESTSSSSVDDNLLSDSSYGSAKYTDRVSLTIQQRIEEIPSTRLYTNVDTSLHSAQLDSLYAPNNQQTKNRNWYLKKRRIHSTSSPVPVPMLVPNPLTSAKVLIGDKEIDDTSDLSDGNSESEDSLDIRSQNLLIESTLVFGKKHHYFSDEETSFDSGVRDDKDDFIEQEKFNITGDATTDSNNDQIMEPASSISAHSNVERDSEYTEQFSSLSRAEFRNLSTDSDELSWLLRQQTENVSSQNLDSEKHHQAKLGEHDDFYLGNYSRKEKNKWNHPVNMLNNPYSTENIRRRIESNQRYGRDYYTKQASLPSGSLRSNETENAFWTIDEEASIYKALPATTTDGESETESYKRDEEWESEQNESFSASNLDIIINNSENQELYCQTSNTNKSELKMEVNNKEASVLDSSNLIQQNIEDVVNTATDFISDSKEQYENSKIEISAGGPSSHKINHKIAIRKNTTLDNGPSKESPVKNTQIPPMIMAKKSDNTLIRKIYSNPVVRNFALINREQIPYFSNVSTERSQAKNDQKNNESKEKEILVKDDSDAVKNFVDNISSPPSKSENTEENLVKYNFSLEFSDNGSLRKQSSAQSDNEYNELKERRLVSNLIDEYSKSFPNVTKINSPIYDENKNNVFNNAPDEHPGPKQVENLKPKSLPNVTKINLPIYDENKNNVFNNAPDEHPLPKQVENLQPYEAFVSVKHLKKLFENNNDIRYSKDKPVHSLTARSISKEMKEKLRTYSDTRIDTKSRKEDNTP